MAHQTRVELPTDLQQPALRTGLGTDVSIVSGAPLEVIKADLLILALKSLEGEQDWVLPAKVAAYDKEHVSSVLAECIQEAEFKGKTGSSTEMVRLAGGNVKRCIVYGIGKGESKDIAKAAAFAVSKGKGKCSSVALFVEGGVEEHIATIAEAANVEAYEDTRYKGTKDENDKPKAPPAEIVLVGESNVPAKQVERGQAFATGISTTKDLIMAPANSLTPERLADAARQIASETGLKIQVLGREEIIERKMGLYLGVTQGAIREPQFIHMTYTPEGGATKKIAFVGKAVCFDSGGYNLKAGAGSMIASMKWDMGGSGSCLGAAATIGRIKPPGVEVHFIMPACENMISEKAIHPGDVLTASNGKTVEIMNTDAEGRLCLADALVYTEKLGEMDAIIDIATLTGAIIIALGHELAGFWSSSDDVAERLLKVSKATGTDKLWRMPLVEEYKEDLKSNCSDIKNIGSRGGSSIQAALFLKEFVKTDKWAHIDIAGTAFVDKKGGPTGYGVKLLTGFAEDITK